MFWSIVSCGCSRKREASVLVWQNVWNGNDASRIKMELEPKSVLGIWSKIRNLESGEFKIELSKVVWLSHTRCTLVWRVFSHFVAKRHARDSIMSLTLLFSTGIRSYSHNSGYRKTDTSVRPKIFVSLLTGKCVGPHRFPICKPNPSPHIFKSPPLLKNIKQAS